ncbi:hypothetical protein [Palleronia sp.]|uniref:hypothetical protein n=1 Tax=Palleronia sp. TaxID=1940284 RepID=UPI0035C8140C
MTPCALYRHYDAEGRLLYIGKTVNPRSRASLHKIRSRWFRDVERIELQWFDDEALACAAEISAIADEKPIHNVHHNPARIKVATPSSAAIALAEWMAGKGYGAKDFASLSGIGAPTVKRVIEGKVNPNFRTTTKIEKATDGHVPVTSWVSAYQYRVST